MRNHTAVVGRLAPSPTGELHLGHARTFLVAWLAARQAGGRLILRVEDLDASRVRPGMAEAALRDLRWMGLNWDEGPDLGGPHGPYVQSQRLARYQDALDQLRRAERIYPCTCTRAEIARVASAPHAGELGPVYPGTCAGRSSIDADALAACGVAFAWRFRVPAGEVVWDDLVRGHTTIDAARSLGDVIVARSTGEIAYQLAVVVDDAAMGVGQVVRGDDLLPSTAWQLLLRSALGHADPPQFAHVPLAVDAEGRRLAKRDRSLKIAAIRDSGVTPERFVGWLARHCGWNVGNAIRASELVGRVDVWSLPRTPWVVDSEALKALSSRVG